jgi:hypothetical protein
VVEFDFDEIEAELDLVVPTIYRMFIDAVISYGYDLRRYRIYHDTETLLKGNWHMRLQLADADPKWQDHYLDFGVGDGCGNYFFLHATDEDDDTVQLCAHDPPGIEDVSTGTEFFKSLLAALEHKFEGPEKYMYAGSRHWD